MSSYTLNPNTRAFFFDVFGTCVNWRKSVTTGLETASDSAISSPSSKLSPSVRAKASSTDWAAIAAEWRATYYHFTRSLAADPSIRYKTVDDHHLESLREILHSHGLYTPDDNSPESNLFTESEIEHLSTIWHRLESWPDTNEGLNLLASGGYDTATLSNGNVSLLQDMQHFSGMKFTHTYSSELFSSYKPNPAVYNGAAKRLGIETSQCVMMAAHLGDLEAAKNCGFQTVYVEREGEEKSEMEDRAREKGFVDLWVKVDQGGFLGVVERLGVGKVR